MKRASMTIPDDLEEAIEAYQADTEVSPALASVMQAALREYLHRRGYLPEASGERRRPPAARGSPGNKPWPRYPLYSGDPTLAHRDEEELAGDPGSPSFGER